MDRKEIDLIQQAQRGNVEAFTELVRMHDQRILQMIYSMLGNRQDACDVYQETFIRAFQHLADFRFECALSTWLGRIAINLCLNWRKRQRRHRWFSWETSADRFPERAGESHKHASSQNSLETQLLKEELMQQIEKVLQKLPQQQRVVFILKHLHGYKIKDIAEMLGCAEGTVKNHLFRATHRLQKLLRPYQEGVL